MTWLQWLCGVDRKAPPLEPPGDIPPAPPRFLSTGYQPKADPEIVKHMMDNPPSGGSSVTPRREHGSPFSSAEQAVMDALVSAWNTFSAMEQTHPSHKTEFAAAIHRCQDILAHRIVQRDYPDVFPIKSSATYESPKFGIRHLSQEEHEQVRDYIEETGGRNP